MSDKRKMDRLTLRSTFPHWMQEPVRWSDTDQAGHVNNLAFAAYCETGRTYFLNQIIGRDAQPRIVLVLAQLTVNYLGEVHWPATVDVGTVVLQIGNSSCRLAHGLFVGERCVSTSDSVLVAIDEQTRRSYPIPDFVREFFLPYMLNVSS